MKDAYGNDLPDYEVVYLLENIDGWLGGSQNAADTFIPLAYLADLDPATTILDPAGTAVYVRHQRHPLPIPTSPCRRPIRMPTS